MVIALNFDLYSQYLVCAENSMITPSLSRLASEFPMNVFLPCVRAHRTCSGREPKSMKIDLMYGTFADIFIRCAFRRAHRYVKNILA